MSLTKLILHLLLDSYATVSIMLSCNNKSSYFWFIIFKNSSNFNHITATYAIIENCIQKTIDIINICKNFNRVEIAREFHVLYERLQSKLKSYQFKTVVWELHNKALKSDQKSALQQYLITLNQLNLSARLHMMQSMINALHAQNSSHWNSSSLLNTQWIKRWLNHQSDLFKVKRKFIAVDRKNVHDSKVLQTHFNEFKKMIIQYDIMKNDTWNFNEINYHMSIAHFDWVVTIDSNRRIYFKNSNNRESLIVKIMSRN